MRSLTLRGVAWRGAVDLRVSFKTMKTRLGALICALAIVGCSPLGHLPQDEQDAFSNCYASMQTKTCQDNSDLGQSLCMRAIIDRHKVIKTRDGREQHLIDMGCPENLAKAKSY